MIKKTTICYNFFNLLTRHIDHRVNTSIDVKGMVENNPLIHTKKVDFVQPILSNTMLVYFLCTYS